MIRWCAHAHTNNNADGKPIRSQPGPYDHFRRCVALPGYGRQGIAGGRPSGQPVADVIEFGSIDDRSNTAVHGAGQRASSPRWYGHVAVGRVFECGEPGVVDGLAEQGRQVLVGNLQQLGRPGRSMGNGKVSPDYQR